MNLQIPCIHAGYQNKLLVAVSQTDYIRDLVIHPAGTQASMDVQIRFELLDVKHFKH